MCFLLIHLVHELLSAHRVLRDFRDLALHEMTTAIRIPWHCFSPQVMKFLVVFECLAVGVSSGQTSLSCQLRRLGSPLSELGLEVEMSPVEPLHGWNSLESVIMSIVPWTSSKSAPGLTTQARIHLNEREESSVDFVPLSNIEHNEGI